MIISKACEQFLAHCQSAVNLSEHTLRAYRSDLDDVQRYLAPSSKISSIKKENLRSYLRHLRETRKFKETSIKRRLASMKLLFQWARRESILRSSPFDTLNERIRLPKSLPRAIDSNDAKRLRKAVEILTESDTYDLQCKKAAICLLLETGVRVGELSKIDISDISLPDQCIKIHGKGNRQRFVYLLSSTAYDAVKKFISIRQKIGAETSRFFVTENGRELTPPLVRRALRDTATQAGIKTHITPHMLRHTCATKWLSDGLDIRYVQKLLGHHSISTTEIYTHVSDQSLRTALLRANGGRKR